MNEVIFDIKKFSYAEGDEIDVSFIPMLLRRKLNKFGRAGLYTLYNAYENGTNPNLVFASSYGDIERVEKLITQREEDGEVSPAGFSSSVHNKIKTAYNSISAGDRTLSAGFLESIISGESLFCYTESLGGVKSISVLTTPHKEGKFLLCENTENIPPQDGFEDLKAFLEGKTDRFVSGLYMVKRR